MNYADKVAKTLRQFERGLITETEYLQEVLFMAQDEVNSRKLYKATLAWGEVGHLSGISYLDTELALATLIDDYVESYELDILKRIELKNGGFVMVCTSGVAANPCTIVVDKQR